MSGPIIHIDAATGEVLAEAPRYVPREVYYKDRPRHTPYELSVLAGRVKRQQAGRGHRGRRGISRVKRDLILALAVYSLVITALLALR